MCWLEMYPEDFNEPATDFATLMRLIEFGRIYKITDVRAKARQLRETYKRYVMDGRYLGIFGYYRLCSPLKLDPNVL